MLNAYGNYLLCTDGHYPDDVLAVIAQNTLPWMLSGPSIRVSLKRDLLPGGIRGGLNSPSRSSLRKMTPQESAVPHSDVNGQNGLSIGTIFAEDEPGKWEEGTRVYEVSEKGPKFIRHFKSLLATELGNKVNYAINLQIDPSDKVELRSEPMQMIVKNGEMQEAIWFIYPKLSRGWMDGDEAHVTLRGTLIQFSSPGPDERPLRTIGVEIPTYSFKLRRNSIVQEAKNEVKDFFTSIPGWISTIETAAIAFVAFFRFDWLKQKPEQTGESHSEESKADLS